VNQDFFCVDSNVKDVGLKEIEDRIELLRIANVVVEIGLRGSSQHLQSDNLKAMISTFSTVMVSTYYNFFVHYYFQ